MNQNTKTNLIEEGVTAPVNFLKRIFTAPIDLINSLGEDDEKKE